MHLSSLADMLASAFADRVLLGGESPMTGADLNSFADAGAAAIGNHTALVYVGENHPLLPGALLSAARAGVPFVPVNYRLEDTQLDQLVGRHPGALVLADAPTATRLRPEFGTQVFDDWLSGLSGVTLTPVERELDDNDVAVLLYTSGTTSQPKAALLRHRHLMAYLLGSVEFAGAAETDSMLISVPPYHVAGVANMLSNLYAGRRLVYLRSFSAQTWLETVRAKHITNAMVVPTMLARIVEALDGRTADVPTLRSLSYGGAKLSERVLRRAIELFPDTGFVNAYGLTETASTIAVLGADDHRSALTSDDPAVRARLSSVGRVLPSIEIEIRDAQGTPLPPGQAGMIFLRGEQIAGEYAEGTALDGDQWFCTRDRGWVDDEGYLFIEGRADDTIIRGGENIAPAEIEEILVSHPGVEQACVIGIPDDVWGQGIGAAVVVASGATVQADELRELVRSRLRGSKVPGSISFVDELPHTETGKMLRRVVLQELVAAGQPGSGTKTLIEKDGREQ